MVARWSNRLEDSARDEVDAAVLVMSAGFTLLRLTGSIGSADRQLVVAALDHLEAFYGPQPQFTRMRQDLASF